MYPSFLHFVTKMGVVLSCKDILNIKIKGRCYCFFSWKYVLTKYEKDNDSQVGGSKIVLFYFLKRIFHDKKRCVTFLFKFTSSSPTPYEWMKGMNPWRGGGWEQTIV
jgi:hypothetical protein